MRFFIHCLQKKRAKRFFAASVLLLFVGCVICLHALGQPAPPDPNALTRPLFQPLLNGRAVIIETIQVNNVDVPKQAIKRAVEGFAKTISGKVKVLPTKSVTVATGTSGTITNEHISNISAKAKHHGPSAIKLLFVPRLTSLIQGFYRKNISANGELEHIVVINAEGIDWYAAKSSFIRNTAWRAVTQHELCHALGVPSNKRHVSPGRHCTSPDCILYWGVDLRSIATVLSQLGLSFDLCKLCQGEIREVQAARENSLFHASDNYDPLEFDNSLVEMNPENARVYFERARTFLKLRDVSRADSDIAQGMEYSPDETALNEMAWFLATSSDAACRDGERAMELATRACELTSWENANMLDTLAAAYAEKGDFSLALKTQIRAIERSEHPSEQMNARLLLYQKSQPYLE